LIIFVQLGGGYLFGLPVGIVADSIGATMGAVAAFLLGGTVSFAFIFSRRCSFFMYIILEISCAFQPGCILVPLWLFIHIFVS
jgi:uncharacterized membrane protein YdjX (TVP38/TMEM64 family)